MRSIAPRVFALLLVISGLLLVYVSSIALSLARTHVWILWHTVGSMSQVQELDLVSLALPLGFCLLVPVLILLGWVFLFAAPRRLWSSSTPRRSTGRTALELGIVGALSIVLFALSWHFGTVTSFVVSEIDGQTVLAAENDLSREYYESSGQLAREVDEEGETTWHPDGSVRSQTRFIDDAGNRVSETRTEPPWFWKVENQSTPTAPWFQRE